MSDECKDCPEKQIEALCAQMGSLTVELERARETIDRLQKECAVGCLQLLDRAWVGTREEGFADLLRGKTDHAVVSLVIGHHRHPLDTCSRCGRPAPCVPIAAPESPPVCSWGCPKEER